MDEDFSFLEDYRHRVVVWRGTLLFPADVAVEAVGEFKHRDIRLLGIEVFGSGEDDEYERLYEACLDFSQKKYWDYSADELCEIAVEHIQSKNEFLFEFIEP
ncbi:hypothetical protein RBB79_19410 [Tunturiibacter empetritectus]|uniref:Uncharacterized protein n=1 Tax=Tunturiibacter lichenicola TaxID=2051959 RepID=A0A852VKR6_9BACT|nr:hypothetical protein [Edaphobacter lichenicola]NYF91839.1 hypothetical protein [Edaphobacter lichenicola]